MFNSSPPKEKKSMYFVSRLEKDGDAWIPLLATEGTPGYRRTDWRWTCTFEDAQEICDGKNEALGINEKVARMILIDTNWNVATKPDSDPMFWDCECDEDYIHKRIKQPRCNKCGTRQRHRPDSLISEIPHHLTIPGGG